MELYHGTTIESAKSILKNGFNMNYIGTQWGTTNGHGIYLTPDLKEALSYGDAIIHTNCYLKPFKLTRNYSPNNKNDRRKLSDIFEKNTKTGYYDSYESADGKEYIVFIEEKIRVVDVIV
jgi:hypothetical protein